MNKIAVTVASDMAENFNPRPRKEGDPAVTKDNMNDIVISIHALVKRATFLKVISSKFKRISIHALVKRATDRVSKAERDRTFQSTPS